MTGRSSAGLNAWLIQRISAVYTALFIVGSVVSIAFNPPSNYAQWAQWLGNPFVNAATALFFIALLMHVWVGVRDIVMDYVKPLAIRAAVLTSVILVLVAIGLWILKLLYSVSPL